MRVKKWSRFFPFSSPASFLVARMSTTHLSTSDEEGSVELRSEKIKSFCRSWMTPYSEYQLQ